MRRVKKSRNGCARCKRQRLKCDEAKPACGRCVRVGVRCPGYQQDLKWSTKYEVLLPEAEQPTHRQRKSKWPGSFFLDEVFESSASISPPPFSEVGTNAANADFDFNIFEPGGGSPSPAFDLRNPSLHDTTELSNTYSPVFLPLDVEQFELVSHDAAAVSLCSSAAESSSETGLIRRDSDSRSNPPPSPGLTTSSSLLVEFYFKEPAQIYSCYDSQMNPFRTTVAQLWNSSPIIHRALQSMAASCLIETFPQFEAQGRTLRKEAITMLEQEDMDDKSLLALCMLGGTSGWHVPKDLGIPLFNAFKDKIRRASKSLQLGNNFQFFQDSLIYWEMLLSWVSDDFDTSRVPLSEAARQFFPSRRIPHPWTGVARDIQLVLQEIGQLIRRQRKQARTRTFATQAQVRRLQQAISSAEELEQRLMNIAIPHEIDVVSPDDRDTPVWHLLSLAEVYKRTGLVQLYHVFPDLLSRRARSTYDSSNAAVQPESLHNLDYAGDAEGTAQVQYLTQLAVDTLTLLRKIPVGSGTRDFQPFLLVALSSELRLPFSSDAVGLTQDMPTSLSPSLKSRDIFPISHQLELSAHAVEISRMREFIHSRLTSFLHGLPPKPIRVCLNIVKEVWAQMDRISVSALNRQHGNGDESALDVFWMDIMIENGWEFVV